MSNIAEGYERGGGTEFIQFLYIAKGSCGEVRAQLQIALDQQYIGAETHESLSALARRTSGMIANFIAHLQGTEYRGAKFSAPQRRARAAQEQRLERLRESQEANVRGQQRPAGPETPAP